MENYGCLIANRAWGSRVGGARERVCNMCVESTNVVLV